MVYEMAIPDFPGAPVMGDYLSGDGGDIETAVELSGQLKRLTETLISRGPGLYTAKDSMQLNSIYTAYSDAINQLTEKYADQNLYTIDAAAAAKLENDVATIVRNMQKISAFDVTAGEIGAAIRKEIQDAMASGNLEHPLIPLSTKRGIIADAYRYPDNPAVAAVIAKYNPDGSLKSGQTARPSPEKSQVLQTIQQRFIDAGVEPPITATEGRAAAIIPLAIAAGVAFFALR